MRVIFKILPWLFCVVLGIVVIKQDKTITMQRMIMIDNQESITEGIQNKNTLFNSYENAGIRLDLSKPLLNNDNKNVLLDKIVGEGLLVFRFKEGDCMDCVYSTLPWIDTIAQEIGRENVLIMTSFNTPEAMISFAEVNEIRVQVISSDNILSNLPIEAKSRSPYFFFLNKEGYVNSLFIPDKSFLNLTKAYFKILKNYSLKHSK